AFERARVYGWGMDGELGTGAESETLPGGMLTRADLRRMLREMEATKNAFYRSATGIQHHAFIEFAGLMNEYIKLCGAALEQGIDFTLTNVHSGRAALPMEDFHRAYIEEKLDCIYGVSLDTLLASRGSLPQQILAL